VESISEVEIVCHTLELHAMVDFGVEPCGEEVEVEHLVDQDIAILLLGIVVEVTDFYLYMTALGRGCGCEVAEVVETVYHAKIGYGKLVVMDVMYFEKIMNQAFEAKTINEGLSDLECGKVKDGETLREEMTRKYGF
jgi:hypothetical protein